MKCTLPWVSAFLVLCWVVGVQCDPPGKASGCKPLHGVTYDPFSAGQENMCLPVEQVVIDVQIMATITKSIRIYSLAVCPETTMALMEEARNHGLSVLLGVFIGESADDNELELEMIETVMEEYSGVVQAVVVGNNAIINGKIGSNNRYSTRMLNNVELLVGYIGRVKEILSKNGWNHQVSTAEGWGVWESEHGAPLAESIDFICLEMNPYYEGFSVECPAEGRTDCISAADYANAKAEGLSEYYTKDVWVCETGWPTAGDSCCTGIPDEVNQYQAVPSPATASLYLQEFVEDVDGRPYYISSAFDRDWRRIWSPCPFCAEMNLALSSFENGICDLCEQDYQLGIFDQYRQRKSDYLIPDVKCDLPALPETRLAEAHVEQTGSVEDPEEKTEAEEDEEKKLKRKKRQQRLRRWYAQQRRKKERADEEAEEDKKQKKGSEKEAPAKEKNVNKPKEEMKKGEAKKKENTESETPKKGEAKKKENTESEAPKKGEAKKKENTESEAPKKEEAPEETAGSEDPNTVTEETAVTEDPTAAATEETAATEDPKAEETPAETISFQDASSLTTE